MSKQPMRTSVDMRTCYGLLTIVDEPTYTFDAQGNAGFYANELNLADGLTSSIHGVVLNGIGILVVGAGGGCSAVHRHSALVIDDNLYLAVGNHAVCLSLSPPYRLLWSTQVDTATCFGLYWEEQRRALISHGELEISRLSPDGRLLWQASGADIFSGDLRVLPDCVEVVDFNKAVYRFDYETGELLGRY